MHTHFCDADGHDWQCASERCKCICGLPMEGHDHIECPVELRACPEHGNQKHTVEPAQSGGVSIDFSILSDEQQKSIATCNCGCHEVEPGASVGFCLWCTHLYADYGPEIEDDHFANHCLGAPNELKESARRRLTESKA